MYNKTRKRNLEKNSKLNITRKIESYNRILGKINLNYCRLIQCNASLLFKKVVKCTRSETAKRQNECCIRNNFNSLFLNNQ